MKMPRRSRIVHWASGTDTGYVALNTLAKKGDKLMNRAQKAALLNALLLKKWEGIWVNYMTEGMCPWQSARLVMEQTQRNLALHYSGWQKVHCCKKTELFSELLGFFYVPRHSHTQQFTYRHFQEEVEHDQKAKLQILHVALEVSVCSANSHAEWAICGHTYYVVMLCVTNVGFESLRHDENVCRDQHWYMCSWAKNKHVMPLVIHCLCKEAEVVAFPSFLLTDLTNVLLSLLCSLSTNLELHGERELQLQ